MSDQLHTTDMEGEISALLSDLTGVQDELLELLAEKRSRLADGRFEDLETLRDREHSLCERLDACRARRQQLLETASQQSLPADSVASLSAALAPGGHGPTGQRVRKAASRMRLVQHQCVLNWVLAQQSLLHVSQMLEIIARGGKSRPVYGAGPTAAGRGALVDQQA